MTNPAARTGPTTFRRAPPIMRVLGTLLLASSASGYVVGGLRTRIGERAQMPAMQQIDPYEEDSTRASWDFRHGPGRVSDPARWGVAGGPGEHVVKRGKTPVLENLSDKNALPAAAPRPALAPSPQIVKSGPAAAAPPAKNEEAWAFKHGPGTLGQISSGGP